MFNYKFFNQKIKRNNYYWNNYQKIIKNTHRRNIENIQYFFKPAKKTIEDDRRHPKNYPINKCR